TKKQSHFKTLFKITVFNVFFFTDENCPDKPVFNPSRLVVKYGDPASVTCSICQSYQDYYLELVNYMGNHTRNRTTNLWEVENMTEWRTLTKCCRINATHYCCCSKLPVTPPDNVSFSFRDHSGPLLEGHQYTLQCEVHNVAPVENLTVTFYRGKTALGQLQSNNTGKNPVTEIFSLNINTSKEDDGVQYWCEAKLELGPEGPQPPPVATSERFSATVNSTPALGTTPSTSSTPTPSFSMCFMLLSFSLVSVHSHRFLLLLCVCISQLISSSLFHSGPLLERHQYTLQCEVHNVAPVENLTVTFYRGQTALAQLQSNNTTSTPVTEILTLNINTSKEDDGVQYWCERKLELGPEGPQRPPVVTSEKISATVNSTPSNNTEKKPVTEIFTLNINTRKEDDGVQYWCEAKLELGPEGPQPPPVVTSEKFSATMNSTPASGTTPRNNSTPTPSFSMCFMLLFFSLVSVHSHSY
uniref:Ig-like domain-containing protein n=1 Tax=Lates calcarifer TaxID=8187 RepID=A0A4W6BYI5_LATCA